jgi:hypothetical protein
MCMEIIVVSFENNTKHIRTLCGQNAEIFNVRLRGKYSNHWAPKLLNKYDGCKKKSLPNRMPLFSKLRPSKFNISILQANLSQRQRETEGLMRHVAELASWLWRRGTAGVRRRSKRRGETRSYTRSRYIASKSWLITYGLWTSVKNSLTRTYTHIYFAFFPLLRHLTRNYACWLV